MAEAQYFHASLYQFAPPAYEEVVQRFNYRMQDVSARCWYDIQLDMFCLTCPGSIGQQADSTLKEVLTAFEELALGERGDCAPKIELFPDAVLDDGNVSDEMPVTDHLGPEGPRSAPVASQTRNLTSNIIRHSLILEKPSETLLKLLRLGDLPDPVVDRVLSTNDTNPDKAIKTGITARAVYWDSEHEIYVFNGRRGTAIHHYSPNAHLLTTSAFNSLSDERVYTGPTTSENDVPVRTWTFKNGETPTVNRFLEGMGEVEMVDPNTEPETPEDAANFLSHHTLPALPRGRPRVPRAAASDSSGDDSDSDSNVGSETSRTERTNNPHIRQGDSDTRPTNAARVFGLQVNIDRACRASYTNIDHTPSISASAFDGQTTPTLGNPFPSSNESPSFLPTYSRTSVHCDASSSENGVSASSNGDKPSLVSNDVSESVHTIPTYDRSYASVDRVGLGGIAANQATWEHENPGPKKSTTNRSGVGRRQMAKSAIISPPPMPGQKSKVGPDPSAASHHTLSSVKLSSSSSLMPPSSAYRTVDRALDYTGLHAWPNRVARPKVSGGRLVDDTNEGEERPSKLPPGLQEFGKRQASIPPVTKRDSDRPILERVQAVPSHKYHIMRYTMNQQAKKPKSKKLNQKQLGLKAELPRPEPLKLPSNTKFKKDSTAKQDSLVGQQSEESNKLHSLSHQDRAAPQLEVPAKQKTAIEGLLHMVTDFSLLQDSTVCVRFGLILMQQNQAKDALQKGVATKEKLQVSFDAASDSIDTYFLPRLTTSNTDALFMLDLISGSAVTAMTKYEIVTKNAEGSLATIKFDTSNRYHFQVTRSEELLGTVFLHYPIHIWDAKVTIDRPDNDNSLAKPVTQFLTTMQTLDSAPSFMAMAPSSSFAIEKVFAKRIFCKAIANGFELKVTEVQDLTLESLSYPHFNFKAIALPSEQMIADQQLWWECELRSGMVDDQSASMLQCMTDTMVGEMDGVGFSNKGPWEKKTVEPESIVDSIW